MLFAIAVLNFYEFLFSLKQQHAQGLSVSYKGDLIRRRRLKLNIVPLLIKTRLQIPLLKYNLIIFFDHGRILTLRINRYLSLIQAISLKFILVIRRIRVRVDRGNVVTQYQGQKQIHHHVALLSPLAPPIRPSLAPQSIALPRFRCRNHTRILYLIRWRLNGPLATPLTSIVSRVIRLIFVPLCASFPIDRIISLLPLLWVHPDRLYSLLDSFEPTSQQITDLLSLFPAERVVFETKLLENHIILSQSTCLV